MARSTATSLLCALLLVAAPATTTAQENLLDTFVSVFTGGNQDRASELLDVLQGCGVSNEGQNLFEDILDKTLNATRTCLRIEINRENADACIARSSSAIHTATSPFDIFSVQPLTSGDIATLSSCATGTFADDAAIVDAFRVLAKRFLQCDVDAFTDDQTTAITDVFQGDDQVNTANRASLASVCTSLHFAGSIHKDAIDFVTQILKHYVQVMPSRRR
jgi:hypothetical protein